jgi:HEAT repeat protein
MNKKRRRLLWIAGILAGLLLGVPLLLWGGYAVLALLRQEHFFHGLPSSYWRRRVAEWKRDGNAAEAWSASRWGRAAKYFGLAEPTPKLWEDPAAAPMLCDIVRDGDPAERLWAATCLSALGMGAETAVPELIAALNDDPEERQQTDHVWAVQCLGEFRLRAKAAVPSILTLLWGPSFRWNHAEQQAALQAVLLIEPDNLDLVTELLTHTLPQICWKAADRLGGYFGPRAKGAVPALVDALNDEHDTVRHSAALALRRIDPQAAHKAGVPEGHE